MDPASEHNLKIGPAFYITQFDLTKPFKTNPKHNKRTTLKIWLVVFCCVTTTTINIKVMEDYSTTAFVHTFTRISCEVGYLKKLSPDEGSQLIKGCSSIKLSIRDIKSRLSQNIKIDYVRYPVGGHNMHGNNVKYKKLKSRSRRPCWTFGHSVWDLCSGDSKQNQWFTFRT